MKMNLIANPTVLILVCISSTFGFKQPNLHWKFDEETSDGFTEEVNSTTNNRGYLLPGTSILRTGSWYAGNFDGNRSGILIDNVTNDCFLSPGSCQSGLSVSFHVKWPQNVNETGEDYIIGSGNISVFHTLSGKLIATLWNGTNEWQIVHQRNKTNYGWTCYIITWDHLSLVMYINGSKVDEISEKTAHMWLKIGEKEGLTSHSRLSASRSNLYLVNNDFARRVQLGNDAKFNESGLKMYFDDLKIWNFVIRKNDTEKACYRVPFGSGGQQQMQYKYKTQVYSSIKFANKALNGYTFKRTNVTSLSGCIESCREMKEACRSFNIGQVNTTLICELNSAAQARHGLSIIDKEDFYYYDVYWET